MDWNKVFNYYSSSDIKPIVKGFSTPKSSSTPGLKRLSLFQLKEALHIGHFVVLWMHPNNPSTSARVARKLVGTALVTHEKY